jgi:hypothetical protein
LARRAGNIRFVLETVEFRRHAMNLQGPIPDYGLVEISNVGPIASAAGP